ncbi:hypothetical protein RRF57_000125 [Xylaria bambusicola]|uniref:Uncharacterized protein n=1 Tax=Xylaria bambusicola TaxID=326684 RepID=A0AAN7UN19_9PEZI
MPSATQPIYSMASLPSRKRRRDDNGEVQIPFNNSTLDASQNLLATINNNERFIVPSNRGSTSLFSVPRKAIALPVSKKFRLVDSSQREQPHNHSLHHNGNPPSTLSQSQQSHFSHGHPELPSAPSASPHLTQLATTKINSSTLLNPCHICHRKPTKKSDLDSFADCLGCGERTCYVCIRACQGWLPMSDGHATRGEDLSTSFTMRDIDDEENAFDHIERFPDLQKTEQRQKKGEGGEYGGGWNGEGHRSVICSRCCVESGGEGDVICLGCLAGMRGA